MPALTPNSGREFPKTCVSDGDYILFTPGNPGYVVIEGSGGSGSLPTSDAADGITGSVAPTTAIEVGGIDPFGKLQALQVDAGGNLKVDVASVSGANPAAGPTGAAVPSDASYSGVNIAGNLIGQTGVSLTNAKAAAVAIVDGSGNQITSFGGGSQFAMASVQSSSALGTIALGYDGTNVRGLSTNASGQLNVIFPSAQAVTLTSTTITGTVAVTQSTSPWVVAGGLTNNNAAPSTNNIGSLSYLANAVAPTWTEGDQVLGSVDLKGNQRVILNAETSKVIGTVNQGTSPWVVSLTSTTITGTVAVTQSTSPWVTSLASTTITNVVDENLKQVAGVALGATAVVAYGSTPAAVNVSAVNAFITNTPAVTVSGTVGVTQSTSPWVVSLASTTVTGTVAENLTQVAGATLGATAVTNFGTAPAAAAVPGVNSSIFAGTTGITATGTSLNVNVTNAAGPFTFNGNKTNNNAAPGATNVGVLPGIANAATQTWTEGDQVLESMDLSGRQRMRGTLTNNNAAPDADGLLALVCLANAAAPSYSEGNLVLHSVDLAGNARIIGVKTNNNAAPSTQVGVISAVANAAAPSWSEGNQVLLSEDLSGNLRVKSADDGATGAAVPGSASYQGLIATTAYPTAATAGNLVGTMSDKAGRMVTVLNTVRDLVGTSIVSNNSSASGVSFIASGGAGVFTDIITFVATNRSSTATVVTLTDGTTSYTYALAPNGGIVINFPTPLPAASTATAWTIGNSATVACDYMAVYAKNK